MKIVLASGNTGKLREFMTLFETHFSDKNIEVITQKELNVTDAEETGLSFVENAIIKARNASQITGLPALADDSGIEVDALNGAPGIYSARYSGAGDQANNTKLLTELAGVQFEQRSARFQCVLVYLRHATDPTPQIFQGTWEGRILEQASGVNGFGYDPIFYVPSEGCSAAELTKEHKNRISHRGQAMLKFRKHWVV